MKTTVAVSICYSRCVDCTTSRRKLLTTLGSLAYLASHCARIAERACFCLHGSGLRGLRDDTRIVESRKGAVALRLGQRPCFPSPLVKPDVRVSRVRHSDGHRGIAGHCWDVIPPRRALGSRVHASTICCAESSENSRSTPSSISRQPRV